MKKEERRKTSFLCHFFSISSAFTPYMNVVADAICVHSFLRFSFVRFASFSHSFLAPSFSLSLPQNVAIRVDDMWANEWASRWVSVRRYYHCLNARVSISHGTLQSVRGLLKWYYFDYTSYCIHNCFQVAGVLEFFFFWFYLFCNHLRIDGPEQSSVSAHIKLQRNFLCFYNRNLNFSSSIRESFFWSSPTAHCSKWVNRDLHHNVCTLYNHNHGDLLSGHFFFALLCFCFHIACSSTISITKCENIGHSWTWIVVIAICLTASESDLKSQFIVEQSTNKKNGKT